MNDKQICGTRPTGENNVRPTLKHESKSQNKHKIMLEKVLAYVAIVQFYESIFPKTHHQRDSMKIGKRKLIFQRKKTSFSTHFVNRFLFNKNPFS